MSCQRDYNRVKNASDLIPEDSEMVLKITQPVDLRQLISKSPFTTPINPDKLNDIQNTLEQLNPISQLYVIVHNADTETDFSIITKFHDGLIKKDSSKYSGLAQKKKSVLHEFLVANDTIYYDIKNDFFLGSTNQDIAKGKWNDKKDTPTQKLLSVSDDFKEVSVFFNNNLVADSFLLNLEPELKTPFTEHSMIDININSNSFQFNGITKAKDSMYHINVFKNTIPQELKLSNIAPENTKSLKRIAFDDYTIFSSNLSQLNQKPKDSLRNPLYFTTEIGLAKTTYGDVILLSGLDIDLLKENLIVSTSEEQYKSVDIYKFEYPDFFNSRLAPFITFNDANYFFVNDTYAVFAKTVETLKSIISDKLSKNVLSQSPKFQNLLGDMADESSFFIFNNESELSKTTGHNKYNAAAVAFSYDSDFAHVNGNFIDHTAPVVKNAVTEHFSVVLPKPLITAPQTVKNHITKRHDIITQDTDHVLYLISNSGTIFWKKKLDGKILGEIRQIDIYKNGRLQLAFATKNKVYVIDRNGNDVGKFPMAFNDNITQPLSVFDYDKDKNYRLLVTQGNSLLMYDAKGNTVKGFKFKETANTIVTQPKHFRVARKDYIVFAQGTKLEIINRQGKTRIPVSTNIRFSNNPIYLYQNKFTTTNTLGELVQVDTKGRISKKPLRLSNNHNLTTTSRTLVTLSENRLTIRNRSIDLDFGEYTAPIIFYLNDKIYVSLTDKQAKKVYLYDSQAKTIPNFPVFGMSSSQLQKLDSDRALELITLSDSKTITVYKLN